MKKFLSVFLIFVFAASFYISIFISGCSSSNEGKIKFIKLKEYGTIEPVDVYEVIDGYMYTADRKKDEQEILNLSKDCDYYVLKYSEKKNSSIGNGGALKYSPLGLNLTTEQTKVIILGNTKWFTYTYSDYFGTKERVEFVTNIKFYKTYHIKFQEKSDTYKITFYNISSGALKEKNSLDKYKQTMEFPKSDLISIVYF